MIDMKNLMEKEEKKKEKGMEKFEDYLKEDREKELEYFFSIF